MKHGSLFSGVGGFDLAAEWLGWENVFHCEINDFGRKVLNYHFPKSISYEDITKTDFTIHRGHIDVLSGGFPCQDASNANQSKSRRQGIEGGRTGLWREMVRAVEEIRPRYVVAENVASIIQTNEGRDFRAILDSLAAMGYNAEWRVTRASEVGACHHRARLYLVAYPDCVRIHERESFFANVYAQIPQERRRIIGAASSVGASWDDEPSVSWLDDGISKKMGGITFSKWRNESIKAYGNAIVPQVAYEIFKVIDRLHNYDN